MSAALRQAVWGWKIAAYLFLAGAGSGAMIFGVTGDFAGYPAAAKLGLSAGVVTVAASTLFLIVDLGRPSRFMTAGMHPRSSWISRGVFIVSATLAVAGTTVALLAWPFGSVLEANAGLRTGLEALVLALAVMTSIYTGVLLGVVISRPFWDGRLLPVLFLVSALSTGIGLLFFLAPFAAVAGLLDGPALAFVARLAYVSFALIALEVVLLWLYLLRAAGRAPYAAELLLRGRLSALFWGGLVGLGLLLPASFELASFLSSGAGSHSWPLVATGALLLSGGFLMRFLILAAGISSPLRLRPPAAASQAVKALSNPA